VVQLEGSDESVLCELLTLKQFVPPSRKLRVPPVPRIAIQYRVFAETATGGIVTVFHAPEATAVVLLAWLRSVVGVADVPE
jgi:hypothetical protein